jgi:single-strand DNA-binding protein
MLIGNVGSDPEMRFTPNGNPVTSFRLATNRFYTVDGERRQETEWFSIVAWKKLAELCNQFLAKGRSVYVDGSLRTRTWEGQDGQKRSRVEVIANQVLFLDKQAVASLPGDEVEMEIIDEVEPEDLPF